MVIRFNKLNHYDTFPKIIVSINLISINCILLVKIYFLENKIYYSFIYFNY